jgi:hypothetical protein
MRGRARVELKRQHLAASFGDGDLKCTIARESARVIVLLGTSCSWSRIYMGRVHLQVSVERVERKNVYIVHLAALLTV